MAGDIVYTAEMGQPPMDPEVAPPTPKKAKKAKEKPVRVPQDIDGASAGKAIKPGEWGIPEQPGQDIRVEKKAKGGMTASARADGIAQRGKTRGIMVACGGGYMKGKK